MKLTIKIFTILAAASMIMSCGGDEKANETIQTVITATVDKAELISVSNLSKYSGKIVSNEKTLLSTKLQGRIEKMAVKEGEHVSKGQLLVKISSTELDAQLAEAKALLIEAEAAAVNQSKSWNRVNNLFEKRSSTRHELDNATAARDMAMARVESVNQRIKGIEELLTYTVLRSPFDGFVSAKLVNSGDLASPGLPLLALESFNKVKMEVQVPEFEIGQFKTGQKVEVRLNSNPNLAIQGTVDQVNPSSAYSGAQFKVSVVLDNPSTFVKPGMYGHVIREGNAQKKLVVPEYAIKRSGQLTGLFVLGNNDHAVLRWITLGKKLEQGFEVLSGIEPGEVYITSVDSKLKEGMKLQIKKSL